MEQISRDAQSTLRGVTFYAKADGQPSDEPNSNGIHL